MDKEIQGTEYNLSLFGFIYGTFPTAPGVCSLMTRNVSTIITAVVMQAFVFAVEYGVDVDVTAATMVLCTILSAPVMFISARV